MVLTNHGTKQDTVTKKRKITSNAFLKKLWRRFSYFCLVEPDPTALSLNAAVDFWTASSCASLSAAYKHLWIREQKNLTTVGRKNHSLPLGALIGQKKPYRPQMLNHMLFDTLLLQHSAKQESKPQGKISKHIHNSYYNLCSRSTYLASKKLKPQILIAKWQKKDGKNKMTSIISLSQKMPSTNN